MIHRYVLNILLFAVLFSCKNEPNVAPVEQSSPLTTQQSAPKDLSKEMVKEEPVPVDENGKVIDKSPSAYDQANPNRKLPMPSEYKNSVLKPIPDPCSMISKSFLEGIFGKLDSYTQKSGNIGGQETDRSCFFKWVTPTRPNGGVMLQIMNNSVSDEAPDWPTLFIQSKLMDGEQQAFTDKIYTYKPFKDLGDGAFCFELGKYHWRLGNDYIFLIAFNVDAQKDQQMQYAVKIGKEVMKNFNATMSK